MNANLIRFESERQRQDRRAALNIKRAKQVRRNRAEWAKRIVSALMAGNVDVARHILETQFRGRV